MTVQERIEQLRKLMQERGIDVYYMPNADDHLSDDSRAHDVHQLQECPEAGRGRGGSCPGQDRALHRHR